MYCGCRSLHPTWPRSLSVHLMQAVVVHLLALMGKLSLLVLVHHQFTLSITFTQVLHPFFVRWQCLRARNVKELFSTNHVKMSWVEGQYGGTKILQTTSNQNVPYLLAKICVLFVFWVFSTNLSTMAATRAMRRRHSSKALDVLHRAMRPTSYHHICMAIKIASYLPAFLLWSIHCCPLP